MEGGSIHTNELRYEKERDGLRHDEQSHEMAASCHPFGVWVPAGSRPTSRGRDRMRGRASSIYHHVRKVAILLKYF
ncbi:hypothetical protein B296_00029983 [Ensete ventricosum]|uniref:Uncharacterized protein n=1 Tax=Ensete ventricosum TaxID=4639 RepID=A0A426YCF4_ENSVE|nr:hypothetical protein B296_00029983 [Ensete ventricosum]